MRWWCVGCGHREGGRVRQPILLTSSRRGIVGGPGRQLVYRALLSSACVCVDRWAGGWVSQCMCVRVAAAGGLKQGGGKKRQPSSRIDSISTPTSHWQHTHDTDGRVCCLVSGGAVAPPLGSSPRPVRVLVCVCRGGKRLSVAVPCCFYL